MRDRKRLPACLLDEAAIEVARQARGITATLRWRGGRIDEVVLPMPARSPTPRRDDRCTVELVRRLSRFCKDRSAAQIPARQGRRTARGLPFTTGLVGHLRRRGIAPCGPDGGAPALMASPKRRRMSVFRTTPSTAGSARGWFRSRSPISMALLCGSE